MRPFATVVASECRQHGCLRLSPLVYAWTQMHAVKRGQHEQKWFEEVNGVFCWSCDKHCLTFGVPRTKFFALLDFFCALHTGDHRGQPDRLKVKIQCLQNGGSTDAGHLPAAGLGVFLAYPLTPALKTAISTLPTPWGQEGYPPSSGLLKLRQFGESFVCELRNRCQTSFLSQTVDVDMFVVTASVVTASVVTTTARTTTARRGITLSAFSFCRFSGCGFSGSFFFSGRFSGCGFSGSLLFFFSLLFLFSGRCNCVFFLKQINQI